MTPSPTTNVVAFLCATAVFACAGCSSALHPVRVGQFEARTVSGDQAAADSFARALRDSLLADSSQGWLPLGRLDRPDGNEPIYVLLGSILAHPRDSVRVDWRLVDPRTSEIVSSEGYLGPDNDIAAILASIRPSVAEMLRMR